MSFTDDLQVEDSEVAEALKAYFDLYLTDVNETDFNYRTQTVVEDALYGIGISLDPDRYCYARGYQQFCKDLHAMLTEKILRGEI